MNLSLKELQDYTCEEQDRWEKWFAERGEQPLDFPLAGDTLTSVRLLLFHFLGSRLWFAETLLGRPVTEFWKQPAPDSAGLFDLGRRGKRLMEEVLGSYQPEDWKRTLDLPVPNRPLRITTRKAAVNAMMHEIRHWAQLAMIVRQNGMAPPGDHDIILSRALE